MVKLQNILDTLLLTKQQKLAKSIRQAREFTPDMADLERKPWHFLFVYDDMKEGMKGNPRLVGAEKVQYTVFTQNPCLVFERDIGKISYPIAFRTTLKYQNPPPFINLKGELYKVPFGSFLSLDTYYQNGVVYDRLKTTAIIPLTKLFFKDRQHAENIFGHENVHAAFMSKKAVYRIPCYMYFGKEDYWDPLIYGHIGDGYSPTDVIEAEGLIKRYYEFSPCPF